MSARTEQLLQEIKAVEASLREYERNGDATSIARIKMTLTELQRQLTQANEALTEGRQVLKG